MRGLQRGNLAGCQHGDLAAVQALADLCSCQRLNLRAGQGADLVWSDTEIDLRCAQGCDVGAAHARQLRGTQGPNLIGGQRHHLIRA